MHCNPFICTLLPEESDSLDLMWDICNKEFSDDDDGDNNSDK